MGDDREVEIKPNKKKGKRNPDYQKRVKDALQYEESELEE